MENQNENQKPWGLMYEAMTENLGVDTGNFQVIYPYTPWDWPAQPEGYMGSAQYDFCSTVPRWSAVGSYNSGATRFNMAYEQFLNIIVPRTVNPGLLKEIIISGGVLIKAAGDYNRIYSQAAGAYQADPDVVDNVPTFQEWLASPAGAGWNIQLAAANAKMEQAQKNYNAVVAQANTPGLEQAHQQLDNKDFYSKLSDPLLKDFPPVPNWAISISASQWVEKIKAGNGPAGGTVGFSNGERAYNYSNTWAKGSSRIEEFFWSVKVGGKWERVSEFESDRELDVSVAMEAMDLIAVQPGGWYNGPFVRSMANGPFIRGYSPYGADGTTPVFGAEGFLNLMKTGMYVCYKPAFTITVSRSTFDKFYEKFAASTGLRIGPFNFDAEGGAVKSGWNADPEGLRFTGTSASETPLIFGITIAVLPGPNQHITNKH